MIYYGAIQNMMFVALQQAMFAMAFDDEEEPVISRGGDTDALGRDVQLGFSGEADEAQAGAGQELASQPSPMSPPLGSNTAVSANL